MCSSRVRVDLVDHRRQRGGLARPRRAGDEHEPARLARHLVDDRGQAEVVDRAQPEGDEPEGGAERGALEVGVHTEAGVAGNRVGEVQLPVGLQALALLAGEDRVDDFTRVRGGQLGVLRERGEAAANADGGVGSDAQVKVGGAAVDDLHQQVCEIDVHGPPIGPGQQAQPPFGRHLDGCPSGCRPAPCRRSRCGAAGVRTQPLPMTRVISAIEVKPWRTFSRPSSRSLVMPSRTATLAKRLGRPALERQRLQLGVHPHHLIEGDPAFVAAPAAARAPHRLVGLELHPPAVAVLAQRLRRDDRALLAVPAEHPRQPLGDHAVERRGHQERLHPHLDQPGDRRGRVVGVQRGEHQVPGEGRLDRDLGGLAVPDLPHHDHVGIGADDGPQAGREGEARLRRHLQLGDAVDFVLDRVLDRDDVLLGGVQERQRRVQRGRLPRARRVR